MVHSNNQPVAYIHASCDIDCLPHHLQKPAGDVVHIVREKFTVADAATLRAAASLRPTGITQHIIVVARTYLREAQNALLKIIEEPPAETFFCFVVPSESALLPTVLSRVVVLHAEDKAEVAADVAHFFATSYAERLAQITQKLKDTDDTFSSNIVRIAAAYATTAGSKQALSLADTYITKNGASKKMLLEQLALALPVASLN